MEEQNDKLKAQLVSLLTVENLQKYVFGIKKSGHPRALYDILADWGKKHKKPKKRKKVKPSLYLDRGKRKKKKGWRF